MKLRFLASLSLMAAIAAAGRAETALDNGCVRIEVADATGSIARITFKNAIRFPYIADKGAGVAGSGSLFAPILWESDEGRDSSPRRPPLSAVRASASACLLASQAENGLIWDRRIALTEGGAEFSIADTLRNTSEHPRRIHLGWTSSQAAEAWRLAERSWIGNATEFRELEMREDRSAGRPIAAQGPSVFWRQIEQYGTGLLARIQDREGSLRAQILPTPGQPGEIAWRSGAIEIPAGGSVRIETLVDIDEGGGAPDQNNAFGPILVRADFAAAGRSGEPLTGFATAVSPRRRRVHLEVAADQTLAETDLDLVPGKVARLPVTFTPGARGRHEIAVTVSENGREIARASRQPLIDGDPSDPVWKTFSRRMPEEVYRGSWEEIGGQLVHDHSRMLGPNAIAIDVADRADADNGISYYRQHLPYYAKLLTGIGQALGTAPSRLLLTEKDEPRSSAACMDVAFYGPDGPINAFSKERTGTSFQGLGYFKVLPTEGYRFHIYMHYGINSEGLAISGATLNEDEATTAWGRDRLAASVQAGKPSLPFLAGMWMLLAHCRTVDEALALLQDPRAPIARGASNELLLDRQGHAACIEGVGPETHIYRRGDPIRGFYVSGNYPHEAPDGHFRMGSAWGWAANTMMREAFLAEYAGPRQGHLGLRDVIALMQSHEAGGMCQHVYDNPGELYTSCSFIAVTRTGDLWLSEGPPCETAYIRHTLEP